VSKPMAPPSPSAKGPTGPSKLSKRDLFAEKGRIVEKITKEIAESEQTFLVTINELCVQVLGAKLPTEALEALKPQFLSRIEVLLTAVRGFVSEDQTAPIAARYVGRALRELGAVVASEARNRIELFAFFYDGGGSSVVREPDHRDAARQCRQAMDAKAKGRPLPASATLVSRDKASKALTKPLERLQDLKLVDATGVFEGKDASVRGNYLVNCGAQVFEGWAPWPSEE